MNDRPGTAAEKRPFDISRLDISDIPGQSDLFLDFLHRPENVRKFYPSASGELSDIAGSVLEHYSADRELLCDFLKRFNSGLGAGTGTLSNIEKLRSDECVAVMTGQQAGLFSGPAYTIYKAVSAILLARELSDSGIEAVPVFWIASEDHDLEEIRKTTIISEKGEPVILEYAARGADEFKPVGSVRLDAQINDLIDRAGRALGSSASAAKAVGDLRDCCAEGETFATAFGRLIMRWLGRFGLIVTSPIEAEFRELSLPIVRQAVEKSGPIGDALRSRKTELGRAGYHSQVHVGGDFFPFFLIEEDGRRAPLRLAEEGSVERQDNGERMTVAELLVRLEREPSSLSPNALMRPVVQDFVFPNLCYFGGAAEIAYFGQNSAIYDLLERPVSQVRHRSSFTILDPSNRRTLESYKLEFGDVLKGRDEVEAYVVEKYLDPETAALFVKARADFGRLIDALEERLAKSEPTLAESLSKRRKKMLWHIDTLQGKFLRAENFKDEVAARRLGHLFDTALPDGALQERTVNFVSFQAEFGNRLTDWLLESAGGGDKHTVLTF